MSIDPYEDLPARHIRLIDFNQPSEPPCFAIASVDDSSINYKALSYVWGTENCLHPFKLREGFVPVTSSLYGFLLLLQAGRFVGKLWADAICIDQRNMAEKIQQIPLMTEVYSNASIVFVWLGIATEEEREAIRAIPAIETALFKTTPEPLSREHHQDLARFGLPPRESSIWRGLGSVMRNQWFRRVWTLQEVVLAKKVHVWFSGASVQFDYIGYLQDQLLRKTLTQLLHDPLNASPSGRYTSAHRINRLRVKMEISNPPYVSPATLAGYCKDREATNPLDRVYGVMGLMEPKYRQEISIDYEQTATQLYLEFGKLLVSWGMAADTFSAWFPRPVHASLPSWCPDLATPPAGVGGMDVSELFSAGGLPHNQANPAVELGPESNQLLLLGSIADAVAEVAPTSRMPSMTTTGQESPDSAVLALEWEQSCCALARKHEQITVSAEYIRTLCMDQIRETNLVRSRRFTPEDGSGYHDMLSRWRSIAAGHTSYPYDATGYSYYHSVRLACVFSRNFFTTKNGCLGMGPNNMRVGDVVIIWKGASIPLMLRPTANSRPKLFNLVGECYLHGVMYGEALRDPNLVWEDLLIA